MNEILDKSQFIAFSGVGAHHQNGCAERQIRTVVTKARSVPSHAQLRWPEQTMTDLWPMAMQHATHLIDIVPEMNDGLSPEEKFAEALKSTNRLTDSPVWGCPTCVSQPTLQDGKKLSEWQPRSRRARFVGFSQLHASGVPLVQNTRTGAVSPQHHVVHDDWFKTVAVDDDQETPPEWDVIVTES